MENGSSTRHDLRRVLFFELREHPEYVVRLLSVDQPPRVRRLLGALVRLPGAMAYANRRYAIEAEAVKRSRPKITTALDRIVAERGPSGYLAGERFTIADLTAAALLYPLAWPREFPYELPEPPPLPSLGAISDHPAIEWIRSIYREHRDPS